MKHINILLCAFGFVLITAFTTMLLVSPTEYVETTCYDEQHELVFYHLDTLTGFDEKGSPIVRTGNNHGTYVVVATGEILHIHECDRWITEGGLPKGTDNYLDIDWYKNE